MARLIGLPGNNTSPLANLYLPELATPNPKGELSIADITNLVNLAGNIATSPLGELAYRGVEEIGSKALDLGKKGYDALASSSLLNIPDEPTTPTLAQEKMQKLQQTVGSLPPEVQAEIRNRATTLNQGGTPKLESLILAFDGVMRSRRNAPVASPPTVPVPVVSTPVVPTPQVSTEPESTASQSESTQILAQILNKQESDRKAQEDGFNQAAASVRSSSEAMALASAAITPLQRQRALDLVQQWASKEAKPVSLADRFLRDYRGDAAKKALQDAADLMSRSAQTRAYDPANLVRADAYADYVRGQNEEKEKTREKRMSILDADKALKDANALLAKARVDELKERWNRLEKIKRIVSQQKSSGDRERAQYKLLQDEREFAQRRILAIEADLRDAQLKASMSPPSPEAFAWDTTGRLYQDAMSKHNAAVQAASKAVQTFQKQLGSMSDGGGKSGSAYGYLNWVDQTLNGAPASVANPVPNPNVPNPSDFGITDESGKQITSDPLPVLKTGKKTQVPVPKTQNPKAQSPRVQDTSARDRALRLIYP